MPSRCYTCCCILQRPQYMTLCEVNESILAGLISILNEVAREARRMRWMCLEDDDHEFLSPQALQHHLSHLTHGATEAQAENLVRMATTRFISNTEPRKSHKSLVEELGTTSWALVARAQFADQQPWSWDFMGDQKAQTAMSSGSILSSDVSSIWTSSRPRRPSVDTIVIIATSLSDIADAPVGSRTLPSRYGLGIHHGSITDWVNDPKDAVIFHAPDDPSVRGSSDTAQVEHHADSTSSRARQASSGSNATRVGDKANRSSEIGRRRTDKVPGRAVIAEERT